MATMRFFATVHLIVDGNIVDIGSVDEAVSFLADWPQTRRGPVYECALRSLHSCRNGSFSVEDARRGFESFARITGILARSTHALTVQEREPPAAFMTAGRG